MVLSPDPQPAVAGVALPKVCRNEGESGRQPLRRFADCRGLHPKLTTTQSH